MTKAAILERVRTVCRLKHWSINTERVYAMRIGDFVSFCARRPELTANEARVRAWLEDMAPRVAAKTQAQALNAVVFLFKHVLEKPLGQLGDWSRAKIARRLPVWLSVDETRRLLALTSGTPGLMLHLVYGCGLRLMECVRLRTKDLDLERGLITMFFWRLGELATTWPRFQTRRHVSTGRVAA